MHIADYMGLGFKAMERVSLRCAGFARRLLPLPLQRDKVTPRQMLPSLPEPSEGGSLSKMQTW